MKRGFMSNRNRIAFLAAVLLLSLGFALPLWGCSQPQGSAQSAATTQAQTAEAAKTG